MKQSELSGSIRVCPKISPVSIPGSTLWRVTRMTGDLRLPRPSILRALPVKGVIPAWRLRKGQLALFKTLEERIRVPLTIMTSAFADPIHSIVWASFTDPTRVVTEVGMGSKLKSC